MIKNNQENLKSDLELDDFSKKILEAEKVLLSLEKNDDFTKLCDFLFKDKILQFSLWLAPENRDETSRKFAKRKLEGFATVKTELDEIKRISNQIRESLKTMEENKLAEARMKAEEKEEVVDDNGGF